MAEQPTKAELQKYVKDLEKRNKELEEQLSKKQAFTIDASVNGGYRVEVPNKSYSGHTFGVAIARGLGFIPEGNDEEHPSGLEITVKDKGGKEVRRRMTNAEYNAYQARVLEKDFHYTVTKLDAEGVAKLRTEVPEVDDAVHTQIAAQLGPPQLIGS